MKVVRIIGGLGNQMFQYAFARAMGDDVKLDISAFKDYTLRGYQLENFNIVQNYADAPTVQRLTRRSHMPRILCRILGRSTHPHIIRERTINVYQPDLLSRDGLFDGYFQSEKYFAHIRPQLLQEFSLRRPMDAANQEMLRRIQAQESPVSLHVRRGDYVNLSNVHFLCGPEYYRDAIDLIAARVKNPHFFLFSDDIDWVLENIKILHPFTPVDINSGDAGYFDMELMKHCHHNIIANSTFSWWGAWLNQNPGKIVVAPRKWHRDNQNKEWDIFPDEWIVI